MKNFNLITYFREVQLELNKVTWPSRKQTINMTLVVIGVSVVVAVYLGILDFIFARMAAYLFN